MNDDILAMLGNEEPQAPAMSQDEPNANIDPETLATIMAQGGSNGNFSVKDPETEDVTKDSDIKVKAGKVKEKLGKYSKEFMENVMKHPSKYSVETSRGLMTIRDAIMNGWDPKTGEFNEDNPNSRIQKEKDKLNDADRAAVEHLFDPANAKMAPADAEYYGLDPNSPMIDNPMAALGQSQETMEPQAGGEERIDPAILEQLKGRAF